MKQLNGQGLALSGGGYRASLFHLGVARRLHELGILQQITRLSSVSGGSILAGFLAHRMLERGATMLAFDDWEAEVSAPFRRMVRRDIRTGLFVRHIAWNWIWPAPRARGLEKAFRKRLKLARLDDESRMGYGPMSSGQRSGIVAITPPNQFSDAIWQELAKQGKLKRERGGLYSLVES